MPSRSPASSSDPRTPRAPAPKRAVGLYTIIAFKSAKGLLLLLLALGIFHQMGNDLEDQLERFLRFIHLNPERDFWVALGRQLGRLTPANLRWLAQGTLLYSLLLFLESAGLAFRAYWAAWLAIGETAFFIPIEIFDLVRHPSGLVAAILVVNLIIVVYLVRNRDRLFRHHRHA